MGYLENVTQYITDRLDAFESTLTSTKASIDAGTFTLDQAVGDGLKLWMDGVEGWWNLLPFSGVDPTPILFGTIGAAATTFTDFVSVPALPTGMIPNQNTSLIALKKTGSGATATVTTTMDTPTSLKVALTSLTGQQSGELYQIVTAYEDVTLKQHIVAITLLKVL